MTLFKHRGASPSSALQSSIGLLAATGFSLVSGIVAVRSGATITGAEWFPVALIAVLGGLAVVAAAFAGWPWAFSLLTTVLAIGITINFRAVDYSDVGLDPQNMAKVLGWMIAFALGLWHLPKALARLTQPHIAGFLVYAVLALVSSMYSLVPMISAGNAFGMLAYLLLGLTGAAIASPQRVVVTYTVAMALYLAINLVVTAVAPGFGWLTPWYPETIYRLQGVSGHPNLLGQQCAILLALLFVCFERRWVNRTTIAILAAVTVLTLWMTNSRTYEVVIVVAVSIVLMRRRPALLISALLLVFVALLGLLLLPNSILDMAFGMFSRSGSAAEILTLSKRTDIWQFCFEKIVERPFWGWGYMAAQKLLSTEFIASADGSTVHPHNTLIQSLFSLGVLGTVPLMAAFGSLLWAFATKPDDARDIFTFLLLFSGLTETVVIGSTAEVFSQIFFAIMAISTVRRHPASHHFRPQPEVPPVCEVRYSG